MIKRPELPSNNNKTNGTSTTATSAAVGAPNSNGKINLSNIYQGAVNTGSANSANTGNAGNNAIADTSSSGSSSNGNEYNPNTPTLASAYTPTTPQSSSSSYDDELASLARQGNYEAYWKKATQLANIQRLAQKNLNNSLKQQGLYGTGEGALGSTQLSNAYLNLQSDALSDFNDQEQSITEEAYNRNENKKSEQYSEWSQMLANAAQNGNVDETLDQILATNPDLDASVINKLQTLATAYSNTNSESSNKVSTYQSYMSAALNSGNLDNWYQNNVVNNDELSDTEKSELAKYYEAINTSTDSSTIKTSDGTLSIEDYATKNNLRSWTGTGQNKGLEGTNGSGLIATRTNDDGTTYTLDAGSNYGVRHEIVRMVNEKSNYTEPTIFHLTNDDGKANAWVLYDPYSGKFYQIDASMASGDLKKYAAYRIAPGSDTYQIRNAS